MRIARLAVCIAVTVACDATAGVVGREEDEAPAAAEAEPASSPAGARALPSTPRTRRLLFICNDPPPVTFSDRPCGPRAVMHEVRFTAPIAAQPKIRGASGSGVHVATAPARMPAPHQRDDGEAAVADRKVETCRRLEQAVRSLDDRMRAGYSIREAARLWARWREAKERLRDADC